MDTFSVTGKSACRNLAYEGALISRMFSVFLVICFMCSSIAGFANAQNREVSAGWAVVR